ncbi:MAG: YebC/PmpR family DNA-binding transcriptional regulator [Candidatus Eisenbacteria sp.]|nr:YebC/PmpR family DNA-binding transcriptional regulator [Candidatus Eisenbacteria bacterium]
MSGHSKWNTIRRKKEKLDTQRGKIFTKLIRELTVAAREGGGDINSNVRLRSAVQIAKDSNMPQANIDKAIKKGTGELPGVDYEEAIYEGYGPGGVALLIEVLTDNRNRTTAELRHVLTKNGGRLGEAGCVAWMFEQRGLLTVDKDKVDEETLMDTVLDLGADDVRTEESFYEVSSAPEFFETIRNGLKEKGIDYAEATLAKVPQNTVTPENKEAGRLLKLIGVIEEHDDVQHVFSNFDAPLELMERLMS